MMNVDGWIISERGDGLLIATKDSFRSVTAPKSDLMKLIATLPQFEAQETRRVTDALDRMFDK